MRLFSYELRVLPTLKQKVPAHVLETNIIIHSPQQQRHLADRLELPV